MAEFVPQAIVGNLDISVADRTELYLSADADTDVVVGDRVPLITSDDLSLTPAGEASSITTHDDVQLAAKGETTYQPLIVETAAPDTNAIVARMIAAAKATGEDSVLRFNIFYKNSGGYDKGYMVVNWFRRTAQRPGSGQNIHRHIFSLTPFKVVQLSSTEAASA